jgi:hypothetical protein
MVQLVSKLIFQGEYNSEEVNLKFSLWLLIWLYPGWVWEEHWLTFPDLDGSICTYSVRRTKAVPLLSLPL